LYVKLIRDPNLCSPYIHKNLLLFGRSDNMGRTCGCSGHLLLEDVKTSTSLYGWIPSEGTFVPSLEKLSIIRSTFNNGHEVDTRMGPPCGATSMPVDEMPSTSNSKKATTAHRILEDLNLLLTPGWKCNEAVLGQDSFSVQLQQ
jgi:hypothetical protein